MRVLELDLMNVVAGTRFRGDFEERMNNIINDIEEDGHVILFIDELHTIMGSGSGIDSTLDAAKGSRRPMNVTTVFILRMRLLRQLLSMPIVI